MITRKIASALLATTLGMSAANAEEAIDPQLLFEEAMSLRASGQIFNSIEVFETLLNHQPGLNRARLELAVAYQQASRYEAAKQQLNTVLNASDTPETVKLAITAYLAQLSSDEQKASQRTSSSVFLSTGLFTDSNVNLGPSPETPNVSTTETDGNGAVVMVSYSHISRASRPLDISGKPVNFAWHSQATAYSKVHSGDENDFNLHVLSLSTGPALVSSNNWRAAININLDKVYFSGNPYSFNIGLNPTFDLILNDDIEITFENLTTVREFSALADQGLDGVAKMYGIGVSKFYKKETIGVQAGIRYHSNGADASHLNADGLEIYLGGQMPAWKNARAYLQLSSRDYEYKAADTANGFSAIRDETENQFMLGASHDFKSGSLKSWTLNGQYTFTDNKSNIDAFEYDQGIIEVNLRRYF
ncbi:MAG: tetratricopeptide repeat protein [Gammaproteobacteria bacterium]|nr:tetratricopeptide repeat protein [Gammaproteobacteria bacterium]